MDILISTKSQKPIYEQIYEQIAAQILKGDLRSNDALPSIRTVAKELGVSVITVKSAWEALEKNGFIYTAAGKGCFVGEYLGSLNEKKFELAKEKLKANLPFYKNLNISYEELIRLIKQLY
ncbi:MAG TPA: GntR family transcriptional regulator [Clostridia bacterium]|nr:GntR family transcriptional regulator [Clostridia bacterium]